MAAPSPRIIRRIVPRSAPRATDAELVGPLTDGKREHARHADRGDRERERGEHADERGVEPLRGDRLVADFLERLDVIDRPVRIELPDRLDHARRQAVGCTGRPHEQCRRRK